MDYIYSLGIWNWFIIGGLLLVLEVLLPGTFMLWLGVAAIATGILAYVVPMGWQVQVVLFAILSVISIFVGRRFLPRDAPQSDKPFLNRRADAFVGRIFVLEEPIVSGSGRVRIDDTNWRVTGPDCAAGSRVRVERADGAVLFVVPENRV